MSELHTDQPDVRLLDLHARLTFDEQQFQAQILSESEHVRLIGFALRGGQEIKEHRNPNQIAVQVIEGSLIFTADGQEFSLQAGKVLQVGAQIPHSLRAISDTRVLLIMTLNPTPSQNL